MVRQIAVGGIIQRAEADWMDVDDHPMSAAYDCLGSPLLLLLLLAVARCVIIYLLSVRRNRKNSVLPPTNAFCHSESIRHSASGNSCLWSGQRWMLTLTVLLAWRCCPADAKSVLECRVTEAIIGKTVHVAWPSAVNEKIHPAKHMYTSK